MSANGKQQDKHNLMQAAIGYVWHCQRISCPHISCPLMTRTERWCTTQQIMRIENLYPLTALPVFNTDIDNVFDLPVENTEGLVQQNLNLMVSQTSKEVGLDPLTYFLFDTYCISPNKHACLNKRAPDF